MSSLRVIDALERRLTRRRIKRKRRPIDEHLQRVTEAGEKSTLWVACAGVLALAGGSRGRRAAGDGILALATTKALVNGLGPMLRRRSSSRPSGHAATSFAFASAVTRVMPELGPALLPLASSVASSRSDAGVRYPSDAAAGAAIGTAIGTAARPVAQAVGARARELAAARTAEAPLASAILVSSPRAGNSKKLERAKQVLDESAIRTTAELDIAELDRLPGLLATAAGPQLVIAAGGDGTVGSVAGCLVGTEHVLGIVPVGTSNDFARALEIPMNTKLAARLFVSGTIANVDIGCHSDGGERRYFVHAATAGVNVNFAKLATRASVRERFGRLTYLLAASYALRNPDPFPCVLEHDGTTEQFRLLQLSLVNAPIVGGPLGLSVEGSKPDDGRLAVIAVEDVGIPRLLLAGLFLLLRVPRRMAGVRTLTVTQLGVGSDASHQLSLDGELGGNLPGEFRSVPGGLRVIVPADPAGPGVR
jgi:diacylglycerol kinase (ATP)